MRLGLIDKGWVITDMLASIESLTPYLVVGLFSVVQSVFGVGLLLFGTPTLLLLNYSYVEALWILLPASLTISLTQILYGVQQIHNQWRVYLLTLPALVAGLVLVVIRSEQFDMSKIVGSALILICLIRFSSRLRNHLTSIIRMHINSYYVGMGVVHGLSNMGGGLLSVLISSLYRDKEEVTANIAHVYAIFAISQIVVLFFLGFSNRESLSFSYCGLALFLFLISRPIARSIDNKKFELLFTVIIALFGILSLA